jgi:hypothetical protein
VDLAWYVFCLNTYYKFDVEIKNSGNNLVMLLDKTELGFSHYIQIARILQEMQYASYGDIDGEAYEKQISSDLDDIYKQLTVMFDMSSTPEVVLDIMRSTKNHAELNMPIFEKVECLNCELMELDNREIMRLFENIFYKYIVKANSKDYFSYIKETVQDDLLSQISTKFNMYTSAPIICKMYYDVCWKIFILKKSFNVEYELKNDNSDELYGLYKDGAYVFKPIQLTFDEIV